MTVAGAVVAVVDDDTRVHSVRTIAECLATALDAGARHAGVRAIDIRDGSARALRDELAARDTLLGVLDAGQADRTALWDVVSTADKPVVVVPTAFTALPHEFLSRVLLPLDGTPESAAAVAEVTRLFATAGVDLVVLHVFDATTVPRFWDQPAHARADWEAEFLARYCGHPGARLELRRGTPGERVLDVARSERVDLIALGWSRQLDRGHARTVRHTVRRADVPVMLVPHTAATPATGTRGR